LRSWNQESEIRNQNELGTWNLELGTILTMTVAAETKARQADHITLRGGLKDFAFALFLGVLLGGYSSIFIASPILAVWKDREPRFAAVRDKAEAKGAREAILVTSAGTMEELPKQGAEEKAAPKKAAPKKAAKKKAPPKEAAKKQPEDEKKKEEPTGPAGEKKPKPAAAKAGQRKPAQRKKATTKGPGGGKKKKKKKKKKR